MLSQVIDDVLTRFLLPSTLSTQLLCAFRYGSSESCTEKTLHVRAQATEKPLVNEKLGARRGLGASVAICTPAIENQPEYESFTRLE